MAGILSQEEIDALLSAVSSGDIVVSPADSGLASQNVVSHDFRRPHRPTKEQIRNLTTVHEAFSRHLATMLSGYLRCVVEVSLVSVTNISYAEFQQALPSPTGLMVLSCPPFEGPVILEINQALLLAMIDRLFGGPGLLGSETKPLTTLEQTVTQKIVRKALPDLVEAWKSVATVTPRIEMMETNPQFLSVASPGDSVLFVSLEIKLPRASAFASLCYQHRDVEEIMHLAGASQSGGPRVRKPVPIPQSQWREGLETTPLPVTGLLGETAIKVSELLGLQIGDVIRLDTAPRGMLPVLIAGELKATARLGRVGRHRALEITQI